MNSKAHTERQHRVLQELLHAPGNDRCADCHAPGPRWASHNLGIFLCMQCAVVHRKLGSHLSKVKSVTLDTWTREQVQRMREVGNTRSNAYYNPDELRHRPPATVEGVERDSELERYIRHKYEFRSFVARQPPEKAPEHPRVASAPERPASHAPALRSQHRLAPRAASSPSPNKDIPAVQAAPKIAPVPQTHGTGRNAQPDVTPRPAPTAASQPMPVASLPPVPPEQPATRPGSAPPDPPTGVFADLLAVQQGAPVAPPPPANPFYSVCAPQSMTAPPFTTGPSAWPPQAAPVFWAPQGPAAPVAPASGPNVYQFTSNMMPR